MPCKGIHFAIPRNLNVLFLTCTGILKPHLSNPFTQAGHRRYPFEILPIGIAVDVEVRLQYLQLFFSEGCAHSFRFVALLETIRLTAIITGSSTVNHFRIVRLAKDFIIDQGKLFPGGQLPSTAITGKAGKVECQFPGTTYPIRSGYAPATAGTLGSKCFCVIVFAVDLTIFEETGRLMIQRGMANTTPETSRMPGTTTHV